MLGVSLEGLCWSKEKRRGCEQGRADKAFKKLYVFKMSSRVKKDADLGIT